MFRRKKKSVYEAVDSTGPVDSPARQGLLRKAKVTLTLNDGPYFIDVIFHSLLIFAFFSDTLSGSLYKGNSNFRKWDKRFFVLNTATKSLAYGKNENSQKTYSL